MDTPFCPGNRISSGFYRHYHSKKNNEISRLSGVKDLFGNLTYFMVRTAVRIGVFAIRTFWMLKEVPGALQHGGEKKAALSLRADLFASSAKRMCVFPIVQMALTLAGSIGEIVTWGEWQEYSVDLLRLAHEIDNYFDRWELDIEVEAPEFPDSSQTFRYRDTYQEFLDASRIREPLCRRPPASQRLDGFSFLCDEVKTYQDTLKEDQLEEFNEQFECMLNVPLLMRLAVCSRMTMQEDVSESNLPRFLEKGQIRELQRKFRALSDKEQECFKLPMNQLEKVFQDKEDSPSEAARNLWNDLRTVASEGTQGNRAFNRTLGKLHKSLLPQEADLQAI